MCYFDVYSSYSDARFNDFLQNETTIAPKESTPTKAFEKLRAAQVEMVPFEVKLVLLHQFYIFGNFAEPFYILLSITQLLWNVFGEFSLLLSRDFGGDTQDVNSRL